MPEPGMVKQPENLHERLKAVLRRLFDQSQRQRRVLSDGTAQEIQDFSRKKESDLRELSAVLALIETRVRQKVHGSGTSGMAGQDWDALKKECQPLIQLIIDQEVKDQPLVQKARDAAGEQILEIRQARQRLQDIHKHYVHSSGGKSETFDQQG
jgi:hypothetical protein